MADGLTGPEWVRVRKAFDQLVGLEPPVRAARLRTLKLGARLSGEVASLLAASEGEGPLDARRPEPVGDDAPSDYSSLSPGAKVGAFVLDRLIGRGGAGEVYLAHRAEAEFEQVVAIKLLRPEAADRMGLFDRERRVLATLEHPGVARLIDGGLAPDGRAFMAMEYVDGADIIRWCADAGADLETRLGLFAQVCEAVAYAHRRLVVHRDIKPSNIIIDREGRARLLDFGVARLLEATADGQTGPLPMLTPEYAAPEQLENRPPTTAADVYGLGAVLFELLTDRGPWGFDGAPMPVILRRLLHDDPPAPSQAVAGVAEAPVPARRLAGDLDAIVLKAMRRNPAERYESVAALSEDLARHRASLPVKAREGTGLYLARRFVRRHRWGVAATAAGVLALLVGAGGVAWQARATAVERDIARAEAARAEAVNQSVSLMFRNASESGRGGSATAKELLNTSSAQLLNNIDPANSDQAAVVLAMAGLYLLIDDQAAAQTLLEQALAKGVGRDDPVATARLRQQLASPKAAMGRFDEARRLLAQAAPVWKANPARYRIERLEAISVEASIRRQQGDRDGALKLLLDSLPEAEAVYATNGRELLTRYSNLVLHLMEANRLDEADAVLGRAQAAARRAGVERTPAALSLILLQGGIASRRGDLKGAERYIRQVADLRRELYGPSTALAIDLMNLGKVVMAQGRPEEALPLLNEAQALTVQSLGTTALPTLLVSLARVDALCALGRPDEAEPILAEARQVMRISGPDSLQAGLYHRGWAFVRLRQGRKAEARTELDRAEAIFKAQGGAGQAYLGDVATLRSML
jgi:tetratricopeptide (TPR) repeat protein/predicted Ser/Thr protein kinase